VAFEQDLGAYLEALEREAPAAPALPLRHVDEHELHRHLLARLRELEKVTHPFVVKQRFDDWSKKLPRMARYLETLPKPLAPVDQEEGALHGRLWCEASDLGGARFVIEVPETSH
jgi:hypothetical protein